MRGSLSGSAHLVVALFGGAAPNPQPTPTAAGQPAGGTSTTTTPAEVIAGLGPTATMLLVFAAVLAGYVASLVLHPNAKCNRCKGAGRHRGALFSYATRPCNLCKGRGVNPRLGRKVLFKQPT